MNGRILLVDDDREMCALLEARLTKRHFSVATRSDAGSAVATLESEAFDVVVTDLNMPGTNGIELCKRVAESRPHVPVIVLTAFGSMESAIQAIRAGAYDFIPKPVEIEALVIALDRAVQHHALDRELSRLRTEVSQATTFGTLLGQSPAMKATHDLIRRAAATDASVLVTGESGTGKELVARALHDQGVRSAGPFVSIGCASLADGPLESELFGTAGGAAGAFEQARGGTLFLDEIASIPLALQPKLLRALQDRTIRPVGAEDDRPVDVRVVGATHKDLEHMVEEGSWREDLFYRLNVIQLALPPLRARGNDILTLAQHFVARFAQQFGKSVTGLQRPAAQRLLAYPWPGNVRELGSAVERAVALTRSTEIGIDDLPEKVRNQEPLRPVVEADEAGELVAMDEIERRYILHVLGAVGGNKTLAANILGLDRKTLYRKLDRYSAT